MPFFILFGDPSTDPQLAASGVGALQGTGASIAAATWSATGAGAFGVVPGSNVWNAAGTGATSFRGESVAQAVWSAMGSSTLYSPTEAAWTAAGVASSSIRGQTLITNAPFAFGGVAATSWVGSSVGSNAAIGNQNFPRRPDGWQTLTTRPFPIVLDPPVWQVGKRALSDRNRFVEARLLEISPIEYRSSDKTGNYSPARLRTIWSDKDAKVRTPLGDLAMNIFINNESRFDLLSYQGRKALLLERPLIKGRVTNLQPIVGRGTMCETQDVLGSFKGTLDPERKVGRLLGSEWPNLPDSSRDVMYSILIGEFSDINRVDTNGKPAPRGAIPVFDTGGAVFIGGAGTVASGTPDPEGRTFDPTLATVIDQAANNVVGAGTIESTVFMKVSGINAMGQIGPASVPLFLTPNTPIAMKASWKKSADNPPQYAVFMVNDPNWDPITNPSAGSIVRYFIQDASDLNGEFIGTTQWDYTRLFTSLTDGAQWGVQTTQPPTNLSYVLNGASGTTVRRYAVTSVTGLGETAISAILDVPDGPDVLSPTDSITVSWVAPTENPGGIIAYRVLRYDGTGTPTEVLTQVAGSVSFTDEGQFSLHAADIPTTSSGAVTSDNSWVPLMVSAGRTTVDRVYIANVGEPEAEGTEPKRILADINGGQVMTSNSTAWPYPNPWITVTNADGVDIDCTVILARGEALRMHREGKVTIAVDVCGYKDSLDRVIDQAGRMLLLLHNEFLEQNNGEGYTSGAHGAPIELFADGTPKFWTSKYEKYQQDTIDRIGGLGYIGHIGIVGKQPSLSEVHRRFFETFGGRLTSEPHGRIYPYMINTSPAVTSGKLFTEKMGIKRVTECGYRYEELENSGSYRFLYDWDQQKFDSKDIVFKDQDAIDALGGPRLGEYRKEVHECFYGSDAATMADRWAWELELSARPARYFGWATDLQGIESYNGDPLRVTAPKEGIGASGDVETPCVLIDSIIQPESKDTPWEVLHIVRMLGSADIST